MARKHPETVEPADQPTVPERTPDVIRQEIRDTRQAFIGPRSNRVSIFEEVLERKRAEAVADRILALEAELVACSVEQPTK